MTPTKPPMRCKTRCCRHTALRRRSAATPQVTTWMHRIVVNACLDRIRRSKARPTVPLPEHDSAHPIEPSDPLGRRELAWEIDRALRTLPDEQRAALVLGRRRGVLRRRDRPAAWAFPPAPSRAAAPGGAPSWCHCSPICGTAPRHPASHLRAQAPTAVHTRPAPPTDQHPHGAQP